MKAEMIASKISRHLRWDVFAERIREGLPSLEPVEGSPRIVLFIEPGGVRIGIRVLTRDIIASVSPLVEVSVRVLGIGESQVLEVSTGNRLLFREFYVFCCTVADRIQVDGQPAGEAVANTLKSWSALIRQKSLLSLEKQIGLMGELLFLKRLASKMGWPTAVDSWRGPDAQEHDFTLTNVDIEVKTTLAERRLHHIASLTQLLPKLNRPLVLVSVQLTPSTGKGSLSPSQVVSAVLGTVSAKAPGTLDSFRETLSRIGWSDEDAPSYSRRFQMRTAFAAIPVDESCPAVVPATMATALGPNLSQRIDRLSYVIDVDGLGAIEGTKAYNRLVFPR